MPAPPLSTGFDFDAQGVRHSFHAFFAIYRQFAYTVFVAGTVLAGVAGRLGMGLITIILAVSSMLALLFIAWLATCYEQYQQQRYGYGGISPYTLGKFLLTRVLGWGALLLFCFGFLAFFITLSARY